MKGTDPRAEETNRCKGTKNVVPISQGTEDGVGQRCGLLVGNRDLVRWCRLTTSSEVGRRGCIIPACPAGSRGRSRLSSHTVPELEACTCGANLLPTAQQVADGTPQSSKKIPICAPPPISRCSLAKALQAPVSHQTVYPFCPGRTQA